MDRRSEGTWILIGSIITYIGPERKLPDRLLRERYSLLHFLAGIKLALYVPANRLQTMIRGALVGLVYGQVMDLKATWIAEAL